MLHVYRTVCLLSTTLGLAMSAPAAPPTMKLWPNGAPDLEEGIPAEKAMPDRGDGIIRLTNVTDPILTVYAPAKPNGTAVLICPGGGYGILAYNHEGTQVCDWLNRHGVTGVLLKYRVPKQREGAIQDAQRAMGLIRKHAAEWKIATDRIGVLGFSAGGHLSARLSTQFAQRAYTAVDDADALSCRPDFTVLVYPAYLTEKKADVPTLVFAVDKKTPPAFLVHAQNDGITCDNSLFYFRALKQNGVPAELHIYPEGGHGFGMKAIKHPIRKWTTRCEEWMRGRGLLENAQ